MNHEQFEQLDKIEIGGGEGWYGPEININNLLKYNNWTIKDTMSQGTRTWYILER